MENNSLDLRIRELLSRCSYSNDNYIKCKYLSANNQLGTTKACAINIVGNHIIIEANIFCALFAFLVTFFWMRLCNQ